MLLEILKHKKQEKVKMERQVHSLFSVAQMLDVLGVHILYSYTNEMKLLKGEEINA